MPKPLLSSAEIEAFEKDGFLILRSFFDTSVVAELRDAMVELLSATPRGTRGVGFDPWSSGPGDDLNPQRVYWYNDVFLKSPRLNEHMRDPRLSRVFCELYGNDIDAYQSATVIKPPMTNFDFQGWHQDAPDYIPLSNYKLSSALTYLCEMGPDTGGTSLVPGSHTTGLLDRRYEKIDGWPVRKRVLDGFATFEKQVVSPQFDPGDVLIFHPCLMHRANSNYTDESKIGLINAFRSVDCIDITHRNTFKADKIPITRYRQAIPVDRSSDDRRNGTG
ncbi:MAG: phytanoyl-CoA dioxygenase family protein [Gammaproteobacteria bacterium]|nr:phytanoyl-CoA dioxygenase family protein [Gammaproteobacteria bacterium]